MKPPRRMRILVVGIYLADRPNSATHLVNAFAESREHGVTQCWAALGGKPPSPKVRDVTGLQVPERAPRSVLLNRLLALHRLADFDYVILADDDIFVQRGFLDALIACQEFYGLALAQPARTRNSYVDHAITRQVPGTAARRTNYVEIGPLVCIQSRMVPIVLPLDEASPMGWGLDYVWPFLANQRGFSIGVIDAAPVDHSMRPPRVGYHQQSALLAMHAYLERTPHLLPVEAEVTIESYPLGKACKPPG